MKKFLAYCSYTLSIVTLVTLGYLSFNFVSTAWKIKDIQTETHDVSLTSNKLLSVVKSTIIYKDGHKESLVAEVISEF